MKNELNPDCRQFLRVISYNISAIEEAIDPIFPRMSPSPEDVFIKYIFDSMESAIYELQSKMPGYWKKQITEFLSGWNKSPDFDYHLTKLIKLKDDCLGEFTDNNSHNEDYTRVTWYGNKYKFTGQQSKVIRALWNEWENSNFGLSEKEIKVKIDSDAKRIRLTEIFKDKKSNTSHPALGCMIIKEKGCYKLAEKKPK